MAEILESPPLLLAFDIGGTNSRGEVIAWEGGALTSPLASATVPTPIEDGDGTVMAITALAKELLSSLTPDQRARVIGAGLGVPGVLDPQTGVVKLAGNLGWRNRPVAAELEAEICVPVYLSHDVTAAGVAEQRLGAGRGVTDVLSVFLGTGIAATVTSGGHMLIGGTVPGKGYQQVGEIGHMPVTFDGPLCGCGQRGCLELYCSARSIGRIYSEALGLDPRGPDRKTSLDVVAALDTDPVARDVWSTATRCLAFGLLAASTVVGPSRIVLGGGLAQAGNVLVDAVRGWLEQTARVVHVPEIVTAELGPRAGILGVALLTVDRLGI